MNNCLLKHYKSDILEPPASLRKLININSSLCQVDNAQIDDNCKKLFELVGVTDAEKQTKETMDLPYDFVEKRGGIENVTREVERERKAAPPRSPSRDQGKLHVLKLCNGTLK